MCVCVCVCVLTKELIKVCETILCSCIFILFRRNPVLLRYTRPVCYTSFPPVMQHIFLSRVYIFNAPSVTCMCVSIEKVAFYDFFFTCEIVNDIRIRMFVGTDVFPIVRDTGCRFGDVAVWIQHWSD